MTNWRNRMGDRRKCQTFTASPAEPGGLPVMLANAGEDFRQVYTIIRRGSPAYPQLLAEENRLKNRFNFIVSNGDFL
jgi:hypothetical protein